jgi:hypothetical protein
MPYRWNIFGSIFFAWVVIATSSALADNATLSMAQRRSLLDQKAVEIADGVIALRNFSPIRSTSKKSFEELDADLVRLTNEAKILLDPNASPTTKSRSHSEVITELDNNFGKSALGLILVAPLAIMDGHGQGLADRLLISVILSSGTFAFGNIVTAFAFHSGIISKTSVEKVLDLSNAPRALLGKPVKRFRLSRMARGFYSSIVDRLKERGFEIDLTEKQKRQLAEVARAIPELVRLEATPRCTALLEAPKL